MKNEQPLFLVFHLHSFTCKDVGTWVFKRAASAGVYQAPRWSHSGTDDRNFVAESTQRKLTECDVPRMRDVQSCYEYE